MIIALKKEDFLNGKPFLYRGHFQTLGRHQLSFSRENGVLTDQAENDNWTVMNTSDEGYSVFKTIYGKITIRFNECELVKS